MNSSHQQRLLAAFAEEYRAEIPPEFFSDLELCRGELARGNWPETARTRGRSGKSFAALRSAVLIELHRLLCTDSADYAVLRKKGGGVTEGTLLAIAGFVAGKCGITLALASGVVGFLALAVSQIGVGVFCRLVPHPDALPAPAAKSGQETLPSRTDLANTPKTGASPAKRQKKNK